MIWKLSEKKERILSSEMNTTETLIKTLISGQDELAETAAIELAARGSEVLHALDDLLLSDDADTRWWGTRTLALIVDPRASVLLLKMLHDPDLAVRQCAALALKEQPTPEAIPALIAAIDDLDRMLSRLAADALISLGEAAVPALIELLEKGTPRAKGEAARTLALIGDRQAIPVMFAEWEQGSVLVQYWIEEGFKRMGVGMTFFLPDG
jgi:HEAT repeat protein